ncbi:MAG: alpha-mannosidase [Eubacteriales bacterium]|jgi:alpha-mannosidase
MTVHMIGNAHIDPVWLWQWQEGFAEIKATFAAALDRLDDYPGFIFTSACASYYAWVEDNAPELFTRIQQRVREGRWVIVGGMWLQPDCNLPSGESFARHLLYSQRYFIERFGRPARIGYNVDSFGHSVSLPKLLKAAGLEGYVFMRPGDHEKPLPYLFRWVSPDGSDVLAMKVPISYGQRLNDLPADLAKLDKLYPVCTAPLYYGVGNHGGGPTVKMLETLLAYHDDTHTLKFSSPDGFYEAVKDLDLPEIYDDLQHHASGCYSTLSAHKKANRTAEMRLLSAERWDTVASRLFAIPAAREKLADAWKRVLFNQFHDIFGGCSIREAYDDVLEAMGFALHTAGEIRNAAYQRISWAIDTSRGKKVPLSKDFDFRTWENAMGGAPHVVFNPHPFPVTAHIRLLTKTASVEDDTGKAIPTQIVRASRTNGANDHWDTLLPLELPALGYRTVFTYRNKPAPEFGNPFACTENSLSNGLIRIEIDSMTGGLRTLTDLRTGAERLAASETARVIDCSDADTWAHNIFTFDREDGRFKGVSVKLTENGPVRATIRVTARYNASVLRRDYSLYADDDTVHVDVFLDWQEENRMLKLCFPIPGKDVRAAYEQPYGFILRDHDSHEEPGHAWVDAYGSAGGLTLCNDAKYSYSLTSTESGHELRLTAVRSALYADHYGVRDEFYECMDIGRQRFSYTLRGHDGSPDYAANFKAARALCDAPSVIPETFHTGALPLSSSYAEVDCPHVILETVKESEDGGVLIARLFETDGIAASGTLTVMGKVYAFDIGAYQVKTLRLGDDGTAHEVGLYEQEL